MGRKVAGGVGVEIFSGTLSHSNRVAATHLYASIANVAVEASVSV